MIRKYQILHVIQYKHITTLYPIEIVLQGQASLLRNEVLRSDKEQATF